MLCTGIEEILDCYLDVGSQSAFSSFPIICEMRAISLSVYEETIRTDSHHLHYKANIRLIGDAVGVLAFLYAIKNSGISSVKPILCPLGAGRATQVGILPHNTSVMVNPFPPLRRRLLFYSFLLPKSAQIHYAKQAPQESYHAVWMPGPATSPVSTRSYDSWMTYGFHGG